MLGHHHSGIPTSRLQFLRSLPIFEMLDDDALAHIDSQLDETTIPAGHTAIMEGKSGREAFIIVEGEAVVMQGDRVLGKAGPGTLLGEMALLDDDARSASVRALTDLRVLVMNPPQFIALFNEPRAALWIATQISRRLRTSNEAVNAAIASGAGGTELPVATETSTAAPHTTIQYSTTVGGAQT